MCQKTHTPIDDTLVFFRNPIHAELYDKPDSAIYFEGRLESAFRHHGDNWKNNGNLQQYMNFNRIGDAWGQQLAANYDMIIMVRSDFKYLFDFPDILSLTHLQLQGPSNQSSPLPQTQFWSYSGHEWGGVNYTMMAVPSMHIIDYLKAPYRAIMDPALSRHFHGNMNCESFMRRIFDYQNWKLRSIAVNAFLTANAQTDITTWGQIMWSPQHQVFFKYEDQLYRAYESLEKWEKENKRWSYRSLDEHIILAL